MQVEGERRVRRGLFEPDETPPLAEIRDDMVTAYPGRVGVELSKPGPHDTPYRSTIFVTGRHSADGHDYAMGDPIPEAEAVRQGIIGGDPIALPDPTPDSKLCGRCFGTGRYSSKKPRNHKADCGCMFCGACPMCDGIGSIPRGKESDTDGG